MVNNTFKILTGQVITLFQNNNITVSFQQPFVSFDINTGLMTIYKDNAVDAVGSSGKYELKYLPMLNYIIYYNFLQN